MGLKITYNNKILGTLVFAYFPPPPSLTTHHLLNIKINSTGHRPYIFYRNTNQLKTQDLTLNNLVLTLTVLFTEHGWLSFGVSVTVLPIRLNVACEATRHVTTTKNGGLVCLRRRLIKSCT